MKTTNSTFLPSSSRLVYRKSFCCNFSSKNKTLKEGEGRRNFNCQAKLDIKIKMVTKDTKKKDKMLRGTLPLQGVITVSKVHSHNIRTFSALRCMRAGSDLQQTFFTYFSEGSSPAQALLRHSDEIRCEEGGEEKLGDGHYMPLPQTVYYWNRLYRELNYGPPDAPLETLKQKIGMYAE